MTAVMRRELHQSRSVKIIKHEANGYRPPPARSRSRHPLAGSADWSRAPPLRPGPFSFRLRPRIEHGVEVAARLVKAQLFRCGEQLHRHLCAEFRLGFGKHCNGLQA